MQTRLSRARTVQIRSTIVASRKLAALLLLASAPFVVSGCKTLALPGAHRTGVIIARRAQIRSSTAIVAADLKEVLRGEVVDIIDTKDTKAADATSAAGDVVEQGGERWLRVRTHDAEGTEGWIESRNVMPQEVLERSQRLADEDKDVPSQATGQLRASANLRLTPDRGGDNNILLRLEGGSHLEIIGWKRVPKQKSDTTDTDDVPKGGTAQANNNSRRRAEAEAASKEPEETTELWYKVRLTPDVSPAPAGWVFGKQVELSVPSDIIFYRNGREFVAWHRLDETTQGNNPQQSGDNKEAQPGSWVILEKSDDEPSTVDDPDFDRIYVLGYDKTRQEHYTAFRSHDLRGRLPLRIEENAGGKFFVVRAEDGKDVKEYRFKVIKDDRGLLRIDAPKDLPGNTKK